MAGKLTYVLDACALIALLDEESGWDCVYKLLERANKEETLVCMNIVNLLEVYYDRLKKDAALARDFHNTIHDSAVQIIGMYEDEIFYEAGQFKATYKRISLGDAAGLATAACLNAVFVTCDHHELEQVEQNKKIPFLWIR
ncbi:MAG: PIN domain-containing protein [Spirochaetales bacterium]|nr:PIN domain-containing protein [Spirochaetales bacterium]